MKPFFSIITRTMPGREALLARCQTSVCEQTFADVEHLIVRDEIGVGVAKAQELLHHVSPHGEYVLILDDDDFLSAYDVLEKLQAALAETNPPFAVVKVAHGQLGEMPMEWGDGVFPQEGRITVSNVVVSHVVWYLTRRNFGTRYAGDYDFVKSLFRQYVPAWVDVNVVTVEMRRMGAAENAVTA